jgi:tetratricopeptide (TPR) repeat protein
MLTSLTKRCFLTLVLAAGPLLSANLQTGVDFYHTQRYQQAEQEFRGLTGTEPGNADAHFYLGMTLIEQNKVEEARAEFQKANEASLSADKQKVAQARLQMAEQQMDQALGTLDEAAAMSSDNPEIYFNRGLVRANRQDFPAAVQDFEKTLALAPHDARAHYYVGMAYNRTGRPDKMVEHFQIFLKQAPDSPDAPKVRSLLRTVR